MKGLPVLGESGWLWDDTPHFFLQPYLSPLMLDKGVVTVTAFPGAQGDTARLECTPVSSYYTLANTTKTPYPLCRTFPRIPQLAGERQ